MVLNDSPEKNSMKRLCIIVISLSFIFLGCAEKSGQESSGVAADFRLMDTDSTFRQMTDFKAKIVMIHFWADWCPHCRQEFPELQKVYDELKSEGFLIIGINSGQSFDHVIGIQQEFNLTFPMLVDEEGAVAKDYQVAGLPSSFFIDAQGNIVATEVGWLNADKVKEIYSRLTNPT
jgi:peroxiredoxin